MATYYARLSGNINATNVWATTPSGAAGAVTFASGDVLMANGFAITINVNTDLGSTGQLRNDTTGGATAGGGFTLSDSVTLTANLTQGQVTGGQTIITYSGAFPNSASIIANASSVNASGNANVITFNGSGTLNFTGNLTGDASTSGVNNSILLVSGSGVLNFTGNTTGGSGGTLGGAGIHISSSSATINIYGNCFGGTGIAPGIRNAGSATVYIDGIAAGAPTTGTGAGILNASNGIVYLKRAKGNAYGPGNSSGIAAAVGAANSGLGVIQIEELEYGTYGMSPTSGAGIRLKKANTNVAVFNYCDTAGAKTLIDATANAAMPAATDVRSGVSYASGALTGSCAVPAAGSVAAGVPVDATVGTAMLTASDIRSAIGLASANLDTQFAAIPNDIRTELTTELTEITETHLIHGLKTGSPLNVTPTTRTAGAISQTITGDGVTTTTVTR